MKRRVILLGALLLVFAILAVRSQGSYAQDGGTSGRFKTVQIKVTQYVWNLVSNVDGHLICQVVVDHPNHPTNDEAIQICGDLIFPPEATPTIAITRAVTPTPSGTATAEPAPFDLAEFFGSVSWQFITTRQIDRTLKVSVPDLIVNFSIPPGQTQAPFTALLTAYEPVYGERITSISGVLNGFAFSCASARCEVPITTDSSLEFWATSSLGDESQHVQVALRIDRTASGSSLTVVSIQPVVIFQDSCSQIWGATRPVNAPWANFPTSPEDLATNKPYQYLAGRLLAAGFVKAPDCPGGGFTASGAPNTCGLNAAASAVIEWQNQFDVSIWSSARQFGIPPRLIKALFEQESQFWPGNSIRALYEFGLGQISPNGADVALRWDPELFATTCNGVLFDCSRSFGRMTPALQATVRGWMTTTLNAECPTCSNGINMQAAFDSIPVFTRTLRSNCYQVKYLMDQKGLTSTYEDLWKFTFLSYHSGYNCLSDALTLTAFNEKTIDWANLTGFLKCESGKTYVDSLWSSLQMFDQYRLQTAAAPKPVTQPTFQPTPQPTLTPTPILAMSHIRVTVYVDKNGNNYPEQDERVDGAKVTVTFPDGQVITTTTAKGDAVIDMTGHPVGIDVTVAIPELYRSQRVRVMRDGEIPVVFRLEPPVVPPVLP